MLAGPVARKNLAASSTFWVPDDVDTYLSENYGTWRSPIAFYHASFDTPNREYRDSAEALLYLFDAIVEATTRSRHVRSPSRLRR